MAAKRDVTFGDHHWSHDGDRDSLFLVSGNLPVVRPGALADWAARLAAALGSRHLAVTLDVMEAMTSEAILNWGSRSWMPCLWAIQVKSL
jgi:hypothetical protein